jgi:diacylglycerol O-acyltransferase / wax synthase
VIERMSGSEALFWHLERPGVPIHTLKTAVLDTAGAGRQLTLDDLRRAIGPRLGLVPRLTQVVLAAPGFPGRPFWVPAERFDLAHHLDEVRLAAPGGRAELDRLHSSLAARPLDRDRPLWALTLVHGLAGGRQAAVLRIHHAVTDGLGVLNMLRLLTGDHRSAPVPVAPPPPPAPVARRDLLRRAVRQVPSTVGSLGPLAVHGARSFARARRFRRSRPDLPPFLGSPRSFVNRPGIVPERVCASHDIDLAVVRSVARATGVTINGVYHALVAAAMRDELLARGDSCTRPTAAAFAVAVDTADPRVHGNRITPTNVGLFSNVADPIERLVRTAASCRDGVELRKLTGLEMAARWSDYTCRLAPLVVRYGADRLPRIVNHVTTANVAGPRTRRFAGPFEVVDWISFAIAVHPSNLNVTAYSYAGRMSIGLVTTPDVLADPRRFLLRMEEELDVLHLASSRALARTAA